MGLVVETIAVDNPCRPLILPIDDAHAFSNCGQNIGDDLPMVGHRMEKNRLLLSLWAVWLSLVVGAGGGGGVV